MKDLALRAVQGTIGPDDLSGATFTISNLGGLGIESFTPLLNPPQVAILGVGAIQVKPVPTTRQTRIYRRHRALAHVRSSGDRWRTGSAIPAGCAGENRERGVAVYDLTVIGAGPGGYEAAAHAARLGAKVALIEKERLGGTCLNVGCIPAKTFLRSSGLFHECRDAASYGIRLGSIEFDMPAVVARKNRVVATLIKGVEGMLRRVGVETITGRAQVESGRFVAVGGERYETKNILIATGSRPAVPPVPGIRSERVLDSNTVFGLTGVPEKIAIIGGGYIGLEFACFFNEIGTQVTVYEMLPEIAAGSDKEIANRLLQILKRAGVNFKLSSRVLEIDGGVIHYCGSDGLRASDTADYILNATGRAPLVAELGLEHAGVDFSPSGIRTSDQGKTNVPGIWACGDVTGRRMLAHAAAREGIVAVNNMFGKKDRIRYRAVPAVIYTAPRSFIRGQHGRGTEQRKASSTESPWCRWRSLEGSSSKTKAAVVWSRF